MAYRQLCALTFAVLGSLAIGCGGGTSTGTSGSGTGAGQPPNNASDPAPTTGSKDQAPTSTDQAPSSTDAPPASSETPAGTGDSLGALCRRFCDEITNFATQCTNSDIKVTDTGCDGANACKVPPGAVPCAAEIGDLFSCAIDNLQQLCTPAKAASGDNTGGTNGNGAAPLPRNTSPCQDVLKRFETCAEAHGLNNTNMMTGDMPKGCYHAGGCEMCTNDCQKCTCDANGDADKIQQCVTDNKCP